jgi:phosphate transport system substrate-binding protein
MIAISSPRCAGTPIRRPLGLLLAAGFAALLAIATPAAAEPIRGAGSTFAAPVIAKWAKNYQAARADGGDFISPDWTVDYEPVGSLAGLMRLAQPELDFAATDAPLPPEELAKRGQRQFPIAMGGVAIVANIEGIAAGALKLSGPVLADIYLGRIQTWSDPAIVALNTGLTLPDLRIEVLHRKDGSGTTFTFTDYLSAISADWKAKYGADTLVSWPLGTSTDGTQGLVRRVRSTKGAIAYVEYGQARRAGLAFALIQNRAGAFVAPDPAGVDAAAKGIDWASKKDFFASLVDQPGEAAYPIAAATFAVVQVTGRAPDRYRRVQDLFGLAFDTGGADAAALGMVPLPAPLAAMIRRYWLTGNPAGG